MTKEEIAMLKEVLNPLLGDISGKIKNLEEKVDAALMANARDYLKVKEVADSCGVTVQSIHWHLSHNPNLEPEKDYFKRKGMYFMTQGAANRLKKQLAKNG